LTGEAVEALRGRVRVELHLLIKDEYSPRIANSLIGSWQRSLYRHQSFRSPLSWQLSGRLVIIQDGARQHTSKATREFRSKDPDRLTFYQMPSYSADYYPIEYPWLKVKTHAHHNRYFAEFVLLVQSVDQALKILAAQTAEIFRWMVPIPGT
jgi:hypothetical protein